nr:hypothetical protein [Tanacetum cinerariifolium]
MGNPQLELQKKGVIDSGCSRHMTGNMSYLSEYEEIDGGYIAFGGDPKGGKITDKGKISTDTKCVVLSLDFKLLDESQVLLRVSRKNNVYSVDLKNVAHSGESGPAWLFDIDTLTKSMNYKPVVAGNQSNGSAVPRILLVLAAPRINQEKDANVNSTNNINVVSLSINAADIEDNAVDENIVYGCADDLNMPNLEEIVCSYDDEEVGVEAHMTNLDTNIPVSHIPTTKIHKDHPVEQIIRDLHSTPQTKRMTKNVTNYGMFSSVQQRINHKDFQNCRFTYFLSQVEPKKTLVDFPNGKRGIGTKWIYRKKKNERGIVVRNKAMLVAQGYTQEERVDYDEVFAPVARIEAIRLFLAYASFKDFVVYQVDAKSAFLYGKIEEEVYVCQP